MPFRTSVEVALKSDMGGKLAAAAAGLMTMHTMQQGINEGFSKWNLALIGVSSFFLGGELIHFLKQFADKYKELGDVTDKLQRSGISASEVIKLQDDFYKKIQKTIPTATAHDYLRVIGELRSVTGPGEAGLLAAAELAPQAIMVNELLANLKGKHAGETTTHADDYYRLLRSAEIKGVATDEVKRKRLTDLLYSYIVAFQGKLTSNDILQMTKLAGSAWIHADIEKSLGPIAVLTAEIGGLRAGRSLKTLEQVQKGSGPVISNAQKKVMIEAGLLDPKFLAHAAGEYDLPVGALKGSMDYSGDLPGWIREVVSPALHALAKKQKAEKPDYKDIAEDTIYGKLMDQMFRFRNSTKMAEMFSDPGFLDQIAKDIGLATKVLAKPITEQYKSYVTENPVGVEQSFNVAYENMMTAIGAPVMMVAIPVMQKLTDIFHVISRFSDTHKDAIKAIATGLGILSVAAMGTGLAAVLAAIGPAGWVIGAVSALLLLVKNFAPETWDAFKKVMSDFFSWQTDAFKGDLVKLATVIFTGILEALAALWHGIQIFVTDTLQKLWGKPNPDLWNNPNPFIVPPSTGGLQETGWGDATPGSPEWRRALHNAVARITHRPSDEIHVNHVTQMKTGEVLASDHSVHREDQGGTTGDNAAVPVSPDMTAEDTSQTTTVTGISSESAKAIGDAIAQKYHMHDQAPVPGYFGGDTQQYGGADTERGVGTGTEKETGEGAGGALTGKVGPGRTAAAAAVADEWRKAGMSEAGIAGIMANITHESAWKSGMLEQNPTGAAKRLGGGHGLYQFTGPGEWSGPTGYLSWLKKNHPGADWTDPRLQSRFVIHQIKSGHSGPGLWNRINQGNAGQAAVAFVRGYLRPRADLRARRESQYLRGVPDVRHYTGGATAPAEGQGAKQPAEGGAGSPRGTAGIKGLAGAQSGEAGGHETVSHPVVAQAGAGSGGHGHRGFSREGYQREFPAGNYPHVTPSFPHSGEMGHVNPELLARFNALYHAAPAHAKSGFKVISGYRPYAQQAEIYERSGHGKKFAAAPPGRSMHQYGYAVDVHDPTGWFHSHGKEYGVYWPHGKHDWPHAQLIPGTGNIRYAGKGTGAPMIPDTPNVADVGGGRPGPGSPRGAAGIRGLPGAQSGEAPRRYGSYDPPTGSSGAYREPSQPSYHSQQPGLAHHAHPHAQLGRDAYHLSHTPHAAHKTHKQHKQHVAKHHVQEPFTGAKFDASGVKGLPGSPSGPLAPRSK